MSHQRFHLLPILTILAIAAFAPFAHADLDLKQFENDVRTLSASPSRALGTPGYEASLNYVREQLKSLPNIEVRTQSWSMMVPVTKRADLTYTGADGKQAVAPVYPFWPASVRVNSTPAEGITGKLVYLKDCKYDQIPPKLLKGQIAVIESTAGAAWQQAFYFGARAVIVLGGKDVNNVDLHEHDLVIPVNLPRFFLPDGPLAEALRRGAISADAKLFAQVAWEPRTATNVYALVRPRLLAAVDKLPDAAELVVGRTVNLGPVGWQSASNPPAMMIQVPLDAGGLVPGLACGAGQAVQTAAALATLRDLNQNPLNRPAIFFFSSGDGIAFSGTRQMYLALADPPGTWRDELNVGDSQTAGLAQRQAELDRDMARARAVLDDPTQLDVLADRSLIGRIGKIIDLDITLAQDEMFRIRIKPPAERTGELAARDAELEQKRIDLNAIGFSVQQSPKSLATTWLPSNRTAEQVAQEMAGAKLPPPAQLADSLVPAAQEYLRRTIARMEQLKQDYAARRAQLQERIDLFAWLAGRLHRDPNPDPRSNNSRLIDTFIGLDLSDHGQKAGPMAYGLYYRTNGIGQVLEWAGWFSRQKEQPWFAPLKSAIDPDPMNVSVSRSPMSWLAAPMGLPSEVGVVWGVPAMMLMTVNDMRLARETPADTFANLNVAAIEPQLLAVHKVLSAAINDPALKTQAEFKWQHNAVTGQIVSPAAGRPVADLPREGFLATYYFAEQRKAPKVRDMPWPLGVRRGEVANTDAEGNYRFEGLLNGEISEKGKEYLIAAIEVFRAEPDGSISASSDVGKQSSDIKLFVDLKQDLAPLRSLVFDCEELSLVGLYDPRFLQDLREITLLDARRNAEPQRYNYLLLKQFMGGFVEPGQASDFLFRYGRAGNRLVLLNVDLQRRGSLYTADVLGYRPSQIDGIDPLALVTSRDFYNIDQERLTDYASKGVRSDLVDSLHKLAGQQIQAADTAFQENQGQAFMRSAAGAWADEARVYQATRDMANDVIQGAIFLLLLSIPFAFCLERLLIGSPNIYRQIGGVAGIFSVMAIALASFHPAFQISRSPLIIILAFAIIFMSLVVIWVVYSRFDTELKRLRSGRGSAVTTSFARASVLMSAVLLGIANMRKRKFRTALTSLTVILITFAVLCFTSASHYVGISTLPTGVPKQYSGLMLRQRGFRLIPPVTIENLRAILATPEAARSAVPGHRVLVEHWWNVNPEDSKENIHLTAVDPAPAGGAGPSPRPAVGPSAEGASDAPILNRTVPVMAVLGLSPGESRLSAIGQVIPKVGQYGFDLLEQGRQDVIYISQNTADQLQLRDGSAIRNVRVGDKVEAGGIELTVAGIYNGIEFDSRVTALSGEPITPLNYLSKDAVDAGGRKLRESNIDDLSLEAQDSAAELGNIYEHLSASQIAIVPAEVSQRLSNPSLRTISMRLENQPEVEQVGQEIARRVAMAMYAGYDDGVRMITASNLSDVQGGAMVAIPLAIAGLIIFNTMMGSIAERRREIHVYTSLGLAPLHVGALFVAEAMTYGLIGTVFGYIMGQGVGKLLLYLGWLGQVTLNYSGTSAMMTMGLILVIVLLSALVPARLASKIAAPSIERHWRVPLPKGDEILAHLPFTINKTAADGVLAYLAEYFDAHQEGSIGKFSAGKVEFFNFEDEQHRTSRGMKTTVWLTPFDLGIRQHLMLLIHPGQFADIYEVQVLLQRMSGNDRSWYRMNRTFLTELRKQFLQRRSLAPARMIEYVEESHKLFEKEAGTAGGAVAGHVG